MCVGGGGRGGWWNQFLTFDADSKFAKIKKKILRKISKFSGKNWNGFVLGFEYRVVRYTKYSEPQIGRFFQNYLKQKYPEGWTNTPVKIHNKLWSEIDWLILIYCWGNCFLLSAWKILDKKYFCWFKIFFPDKSLQFFAFSRETLTSMDFPSK